MHEETIEDAAASANKNQDSKFKYQFSDEKVVTSEDIATEALNHEREGEQPARVFGQRGPGNMAGYPIKNCKDADKERPSRAGDKEK